MGAKETSPVVELRLLAHMHYSSILVVVYSKDKLKDTKFHPKQLQILGWKSQKTLTRCRTCYFSQKNEEEHTNIYKLQLIGY